MACVHEFGIIETEIPEEEFNDYEPEKYQCISVHDDDILPVADALGVMKTYWHSLNRPSYGLAYTGITIIPPGSLAIFQGVLLSAAHKDPYHELLALIATAARKNRHMIHFGV